MMKRLFAFLLTLAMILSCTALAADFNASVTFGEDSNGNMTVTVQHSDILAQQKPTLTVPCNLETAYVSYQGETVPSTLKDGEITFEVAAGGVYTIIEDTAPTPDPDPSPDPDPTPTPDPEPSVPTEKPSDSAQDTTTEVIIGGSTDSGSTVDVSAKVEITTGNATITMDQEQLKESLEQQIKPSADSAGTPTEASVTIDLSEADQPVSTVILDSDNVSAIAEAAADPKNTVSGLTIKVETGEITLDAVLLTQAADLEGDLTVKIASAEPKELTKSQQKLVGKHPVVEISVSAGDQKLTDLGDGRIHASLPYVLGKHEDPNQLVIWRVTEDGTVVPIPCVYENGKVSFWLDHLSHYVVVHFPFTDIEDAWYYQDVAYVWQTGLMSGTGTTTFSPEVITSRGMLVTILWRLEGSPVAESATFADVAAGSYCEQAVAWAAENGIVLGTGENTFAPDVAITREQFAAILYRYAGSYLGVDVSVGENTNILSYSDAFSISDYAYPALQWACGSGLMSGADGALCPSASAMRMEAAALLHRFCENIR